MVNINIPLALYFTFINILCSSKLKPMLEAASDYEMGEERNFSDAFTELCVPTGEKAQVF